MKKVIYPAVFLLISVLTSCQNDNSVNPRPTDDIISRVVVSGRVRAELNTTNAILENVPDGLKVVAEISTRDLVLNPGSGNYPSKYYEATIANGLYSIEVEAGPYGSDVTVYFPEFRADVQTASTPQSTVFSSTTRSVYIVKGVNQIIDINY